MNPESAQIRPITEAEIESYRRCLDLVCRERLYLGALQAPPLERTRAFVQEHLEKHRLMFVALVEEEVVGWCDITPLSRPILAHRGELGMGVHPLYRGKGLGRLMIRTVLEAAHQAGLEQVELSVRTDNRRAIALYEQEGFQATGTTPRAIKIDGAYYDCLSMLLLLGDRHESPVDPEAVVQRQLAAYNARDVEAILATYSEEAQQFEFPATLLASGSAQLRERFDIRFQEPNLHAQLLHRTVMGNTVVDHERVTRTFPEGTGSTELVAIYEVQDGKIAKAWFISGKKRLDQPS